MPVLLVQNDFTHGEIDPQLKSRPDLALFSKSAQLLRNVVVTPTGATKRRFGTDYTTHKVVSGKRLVSFEYDENTKYLLWFRDLIIYVYKDDGTQVATVVTTYPTSILDDGSLKYTKTKNVLILTHSAYPPAKLIRGATDTDWVLTPLVFKNLPAYDFAQNYNGATFTLSSVDAGSATLTSDIAIFTPQHAGGIFIGIGTSDVEQNGFARIVSYTNPTTVTLTIQQKFGSTTLYGNECYLGETAWNSVRGWPQSATFYEGRLVFGGSLSLPSTDFMSVSNDYLNYDVGTGLDSDSIQFTIATDAINSIRYVVSDRSFQIFTTDGEFVSPQSESLPLTPGNTSFRKQTNNGCENVLPLVLDNQTFFVRKGGKAIMSFIYDNDRGSYQATTASLLSPHLIRNPVDGAILQGSSDDPANYLFYVNADGTLAIFQTLLEQNIAAWTLSDTDGLFKRVVNVGADIFFIITRSIEGTDYDFLEKLNWDIFTDCSITKTLTPAGTLVTGLDYLNGKEVQVKADGYVFNPKTVIGGQITLEDTATNVIIGLPYYPRIKPNPIHVMTQRGSTLYIKKRIIRVFIDYYQSLGIYINDELIPDMKFGDVLDEVPIVKTDVYEYNNLTDWEIRESIEITQKDPLPMTILGIGYEVEVNNGN